MKFLLKTFLVVIAIVTISGCSKDDNSVNNGTIQFSLIIENTAFKSVYTDEIKSIVISIIDANSSVIYNTEVVELTNFNGAFISKPIDLKPGNYKLTQFHVVDVNNKVIYSAPVEHSKKAYLVNNPLPIEFSVSKDEVSKISPEVLCVNDAVASDFGYATFSLNVVNTFDFLISVFIYNSVIENYELTNAYIKIKGDGFNEVYSDSLLTISNKITLRDDWSEYSIEIYKSNYKTYVEVFDADSLKLMFEKPLMVILEEKDSVSIPGLVAHYPLNGNINDASGNDMHGEDYGASGYVSGFNSLARNFTNIPDVNISATDYFIIPNVINSSEFTINFWVNLSNTGTHQSLFYLSAGDDWVRSNFWLEVDRSMKLCVMLNGLDLRTIDYSHQALVDALFNDTYLNSAPLAENKYQNVTCAFKNSVITLYIDGIAIAEYANVNAVVGTPDVPIIVGVCPKPGMLYYTMSGQLDDLRFYNRALSDEEISALAND